MTSTESGAAPMSALASLSGQLGDIVAAVGAATVALKIDAGRQGRGAAGAVSGLVWRPGLVVTTAHSFRRPPSGVTLVGEGGAEFEASLVGLDTSTDLALFRLADAKLAGAASAAPDSAGADPATPAGGALPAATPGSADTLRAGHLAVAVARSTRGDLSGSFGMVHRAAGPWQTWLGGQLERRIELDGGLHDGESGAPVADASGAVIGIATPALSRRHAIVVPAGTIDQVVDALLAKGHVARAFLGIGAQPVEAGDATGLLVTALADPGPAARAGLLVGDIVLTVAGRRVTSLADLRHALAGKVGDTVPVTLSRGGVATPASVTVGAWPQASRRC